MAKTKTSEIKIQVDLNENNLPIEMRWEAEGSDMNKSVTSAFLLSLWDPNEKNTMKIDLWTKDMPLDEMKIFFYQILTSMSSTFKRATQDEKMSQTMLDFCDYFAEKLEIKK